jgi:hypothetical protein
VTPLPNGGLYRRATAAALVAGPLLFLVDNLLHPKEHTRDHEAQQLAEIGEAYTRWQLAHALGFLALIVFAAAVLGLAFLVRRHRPTLGLVGGALGVVGLLAGAAVFAIDGYTWGVLGDVSTKPGVDRETVELTLHEVQNSSWSLVYYLPVLLWIVGIATLAIGAARYAGVPRLAGAVLALGAVMVGIESGVISNAYFIVASAVWLVGGVLMAGAIARMSDAEFTGQAAGGRAGDAQFSGQSAG